MFIKKIINNGFRQFFTFRFSPNFNYFILLELMSSAYYILNKYFYNFEMLNN